MKIMLVSDFDGTISKRDFFEHAIDHLLTKEDIAPWQEYLSEKITHIEALKRIFEKIKIKEKEFHDFVLTLPIEEKFADTVKLAKSKGILGRFHKKHFTPLVVQANNCYPTPPFPSFSVCFF